MSETGPTDAELGINYAELRGDLEVIGGLSRIVWCEQEVRRQKLKEWEERQAAAETPKRRSIDDVGTNAYTVDI